MSDNAAFSTFKMETCRAFNRLGTPIKIAQSQSDVDRVVQFIKDDYKTSFPSLKPAQSSDYIDNSFNFYTEDDQGEIDSTISLVVDSEQGFPEEHLLREDIQYYRDEGLRIFQLGRFVVSGKDHGAKRAMRLLQVLYLLPKLVGGNVVLGMVRTKDIVLHEKRFGAKVLNRNTGETYGSEHEFATVAWLLNQLKPAFFQKTGCPQINPADKPIYQQYQWNRYAASFGSVQTNFQRELQLATLSHLTGNVADFGCGTAKLAPMLNGIDKVSSYLGIDYSRQMIDSANVLMSSLNHASFTVQESKIEEFTGRSFDSAVSINSYYSWPEPEMVLRHIAELLKPGGMFVLATPNRQIRKQMPKMLREAEKELLLHPCWSAFKAQNLAIVDNEDAHFITMDDLITQVRTVGFEVHSCHQSFYLGALNFLVLSKKIPVKNRIAA